MTKKKEPREKTAGELERKVKHQAAQIDKLQRKAAKDATAITVLTDGLAMLESPRAMTAVDVERSSWEIWAYTRKHRHSLNSDTACRRIRNAIELSQLNLKCRLEEAIMDVAEYTETIKKLKKERTQLTSAVEQAMRVLKSLDKIEGKVGDIRLKVDRVKATVDELYPDPDDLPVRDINSQSEKLTEVETVPFDADGE